MRKTILKAVTLVAFLGCCRPLVATTGELRTPVARFPYHYPLKSVDDWNRSLNFFSDAYVRCADKGLAKDCCNNSEEVPLSQLFFGKADFKGEEVFYGGSITLTDVIQSVPAYLKYITMKPRFKYQEKGANFGIEAEYRFEDDSKWRVGGCASIPFKVIELERIVCSSTMTDQAALDEALSGVVCRKSQTLYLADDGAGNRVIGNAVTACVPAYRLDFLTSLDQANGKSMVEYDTGSVRIAGIEVAKRTGAGVLSAVGVLKNDNSVCPTEYFATPDNATGIGTDPVISDIQTLISTFWVNDDGAIQTGVTRGAFVSDITQTDDYTLLGQKAAALETLYVVPVYNSKPNGAEANTQYLSEAVIIMNAIEEAISDLYDHGAQQAEQYFYNQGVHFCQTEKNVGVGDLATDVYIAYDHSDKKWCKAILGAVFPTGKKICDPGLLLSQPTGNNGHFEIKGALQAGWKPNKWCAVHGDISYNHVFEADEWRGAAFAGATVKNIGPKIKARIKWGYFTGHLDLTIFHPENQNFGFSLGYEGYVKRCDKIKFCGDCTNSNGATMQEFEIRGSCGGGDVLNAAAKELDPSVMAKDTKRISHKIRGEVFHRWNYCELFAGASHVVGGKNIMKETEAHIGFGFFW